MYEYIIGKINYTNSSYVILENSFIGYKIYLNGIEQLDINTYHKIYLHVKVSTNNKGNYIYEYYGFKSISEKYFFELLLTLTGIGPKTAMTILKSEVSLLKKLIKANDLETLQSLPGFTNKIALMVINHLGYKLRNDSITKSSLDSLEDKNENNGNDWADKIPDIVNSLKALGYKKSDIEFALNKLEGSARNSDCDINDLISEAIKTIIGKNEHTSIKTN